MVAVDSAVPAASTLAVDIGSIVRVTGLPRGSATLVDVFVEGVNDTIRADSWTRTFNTSPLQVGGQVWLLGDATYGVLGVTTTLGI
jgi:hypothetical protein